MEMRHLVDGVDESSGLSDREQLDENEMSRDVYDRQLSESVANAKCRVNLRKQLSLGYAVAIVAGSMIGSGIFFTPYQVLEHSGSAGAALLVWSVAGVISLAGGLCCCELGSSMPESGGEYLYLTRAYGQLVGFLYVWSSCLVIRPVTLAIITLTCSKYLIQPFYAIDCPPPRLAVTCIGITTNILIGAVNIIIALIGIVVMGLYWAVKYQPEMLSKGFENTTTNVSGIGLAFYAALWAYTGWTDLNYVAEEVSNPQKNIPRAIIIAIILVIVCYLAVNLAYLSILEKWEFSDAVAIVAGKKILGKAGVVIMVLCVALSTFGAACGSCMTATRVWFAGGRMRHFPKLFALLHVEYLTPVVSIVAQVALTCVYLAIGTLESLVDALSFVLWIIYICLFFSVYILRRKEPNLERPYKVWVWLPACMLLVGIYLVIVPLVQHPYYFLILLFYVPAVVIYYFFVQGKRYCLKLRQLIDAATVVLMHLFNAAQESH